MPYEFADTRTPTPEFLYNLNQRNRSLSPDPAPVHIYHNVDYTTIPPDGIFHRDRPTRVSLCAHADERAVIELNYSSEDPPDLAWCDISVNDARLFCEHSDTTPASTHQNTVPSHVSEIANLTEAFEDSQAIAAALRSELADSQNTVSFLETSVAALTAAPNLSSENAALKAQISSLQQQLNIVTSENLKHLRVLRTVSAEANATKAFGTQPDRYQFSGRHVFVARSDPARWDTFLSL